LKWAIATKNPDKFREIEQIIGSKIGELTFLGEIEPELEVEEPYITLEENAIHKVKTVYSRLKLPCIAEDTGLFVYSLGGAPGVFSARFSGEDADYRKNREKLLSLLSQKPPSERLAYFLCVAALINERGELHLAKGRVDGIITLRERGNYGFGYDPIFLYPPLGRTFAEIPPDVKNKISHRARALLELISQLRG
jgi:XTP/dITP diphosphohydrolase